MAEMGIQWDSKGLFDLGKQGLLHDNITETKTNKSTSSVSHSKVI
jgi:hypothetical protein